MVTSELAPEPVTAHESALADPSELLRWQLRVARRADALARESPPATPEADRQLWLRAELESFGN